MAGTNDTVKTAHLMHEMLLALSGIDTLFTAKDPMIPDYNRALLEPSEAEILQRILQFGKQYKEIQEFISDVNAQKLKDEKLGLYMIAFVEALSEAVQPYWYTIVELERDITYPVACSLEYVWSRVYKHCDLLARLKKIVNNVGYQKLRGCLLLEYIQYESSYCAGLLSNPVKPILEAVNKVFYHQIFCWMVYGQLVDTYDEFFIKENSSSNSSDTPFNRFSINASMLPKFIARHFAARILHVGQTVQFLRSNPLIAINDENPDPKSEFCIIGDDLMKRKEKKIQKRIEEMQKVSTWNERNSMVSFVAQVSACVTKELWTLAHKDAKVVDQLRLVKEFFLLGRGELFHEFVVQVDQNFGRGLAGYNESTIDLDLNSILQEACQKIHVKEDFLQRFRLEYKKSGNEEKPMSLGGEWSDVTVKYDIPWPLQLIFTPTVLHAYNRIFQFLLRLKKVQVKLVNCWLCEKTKKLGDNDRRSVLHRNLWFMINNLQYYLHADVLESQFDIFESAVKNSKDFDEIEKAHTIFIQNLAAQLFLYETRGEAEDEPASPVPRLCQATQETAAVQQGVRLQEPGRKVHNTPKGDYISEKEVGSSTAKTAINKNMNKILKICEEYCREVEAHEDRDIEDMKIRSMLLRFESCVECLLKLLSKFSNEESYPGNQYLSQFLLRLDYNSFFTEQITTAMKMLHV